MQISQDFLHAATINLLYAGIAILTFDSLADLTAALGSPEGQAAAADVANFATGGASMQMYETRQA